MLALTACAGLPNPLPPPTPTVGGAVVPREPLSTSAPALPALAARATQVQAALAQDIPILRLTGLEATLALAQEIALWRRTAPGARAGYANYWAALAALTAAAAFSLADVTRAWCDPDDHWLQGHALWHVLSASALVLLQRFYAARAPAAA